MSGRRRRSLAGDSAAGAEEPRGYVEIPRIRVGRSRSPSRSPWRTRPDWSCPRGRRPVREAARVCGVVGGMESPKISTAGGAQPRVRKLSLTAIGMPNAATLAARCATRAAPAPARRRSHGPSEIGVDFVVVWSPLKHRAVELAPRSRAAQLLTGIVKCRAANSFDDLRNLEEVSIRSARGERHRCWAGS